MDFKFKVGQPVSTRSNEIGTIEERKEDEFGCTYLIKVGTTGVKWVNEDHLRESVNEEYLTEG